MELIDKLILREAELETKIENYNKFLIEKWNSVDRSKVISDKNAASVELKTVRYSLENLRNGRPILGDCIAEEEIIISENKKNKQL